MSVAVISAREMKVAVSVLSKVTKGVTLPMLRNVVLTGCGIVGTNVDMFACIPLAVNTQEPVVVPLDVLKGLDLRVKSGDILIQNLDNEKVTITQDNAATEIKWIDPDEYPTAAYTDSFRECKGVEMILEPDETTMLRELIKEAAAKDDSRPVLASVHITSEVIESADGFRAAFYEHNRTFHDTEYDVLLKRSHLDLLPKGKNVQVWFGRRRRIVEGGAEYIEWGFQTNDGIMVYIASRQLDGTFPDLRQVIPDYNECEVRAVAYATALEPAAKLNGAYSDVLVFQPDGVARVKPENGGEPMVYGSAVTWAGNYDYFEVAFNRHYARWALRGLNGNEGAVTFAGNSPNSPWMVQRTGRHNTTLKIAIMPMIIGPS